MSLLFPDAVLSLKEAQALRAWYRRNHTGDPPPERGVYGLIDPRRTKCVRFVGATGDLLLRAATTWSANPNYGTPLREWLVGLKAEGVGPHLVVLELLPALTGPAERYTRPWIKRLGADLNTRMSDNPEARRAFRIRRNSRRVQHTASGT